MLDMKDFDKDSRCNSLKCNYDSTQSHSRVTADLKNNHDEVEFIDDDIVFIGSTNDGVNEVDK